MLELRQFQIPQWPFGKVTFFSTPSKALAHLCDHVLTRPEAHYWAHLIPGFTDHVDPADDDGLYRFARSLWTTRPPLEAAQRLYDGYSDLLAQAMSDAIRQGWYWAEEEIDGPSWRGLGVSGVYVIWREDRVRTGMLLGYTAPPTSHEPERRKTNPLPRQHAWKYRGADPRHEDTFPRVASDSREALYHVFKKGAVRVRREFKHAVQAGKVTGGGAYLGSLHAGVPDFDTWKQLQVRPSAFSLN